MSPNRVNAAKTHCIRGHEFTSENTYIRNDNGHRACRACIKMRPPHKNKARHSRNTKLKSKYGLTEQTFRALLATQDGRCAICCIELTYAVAQRRTTAHIDHDHKTGRVRGILCMLCNNALGSLQDDIERALRIVEYLGGRVCRACNRNTTSVPDRDGRTPDPG